MSAVSHEQLIGNSVMYTPLVVHTPQVLRDLNQLLSYKASEVTYGPVTQTTGCGIMRLWSLMVQ